MSNRWSPDEDPRDAGWSRSPYPPQSQSQSSDYDDPRYGSGGYGGYGGYGTPGPYSSGRSGGRPPQQNDPWSEYGEPPVRGNYQPGRPYPQGAQYPDASYGNPDPYRMESQYGQYGPQDPYGPGGYGGQPAPRRRSRNWLLPILAVLVLALVVAAGAYAYKTYGPHSGGNVTTTTTPGIPAGFHAYSSTSIGARFVVPDGWTTQDNIAVAGGHEMQATSADGSAALVVGALPGTGDPAGGANGALVGMSSSGSVDHKEGPTNVTLAGTSWVREAGDITRSGVHLHGVVFVTTHGSHTYLMAFVATASSFSDDNTHYFQVTTQSFQFLL